MCIDLYAQFIYNGFALIFPATFDKEFVFFWIPLKLITLNE